MAIIKTLLAEGCCPLCYGKVRYLGPTKLFTYTSCKSRLEASHVEGGRVNGKA